MHFEFEANERRRRKMKEEKHERSIDFQRFRTCARKRKIEKRTQKRRRRRIDRWRRKENSCRTSNLPQTRPNSIMILLNDEDFVSLFLLLHNKDFNHVAQHFLDASQFMLRLLSTRADATASQHWISSLFRSVCLFRFQFTFYIFFFCRNYDERK